MLPKQHQKWEQAYFCAALEGDGQKTASRIGAAREAVAERKKDLEGSSDHHAERRDMDAALEILNGLEDESRVWPLVGQV